MSALLGSNQGPNRYKRFALPTELRADIDIYYDNFLQKTNYNLQKLS